MILNSNNPTLPGNLALNWNLQGKEASSDTKAVIGLGAISLNNNQLLAANDERLKDLTRNLGQRETNKREQITSDFEASLKIDLRLVAALSTTIAKETTDLTQKLITSTKDNSQLRLKDGLELDLITTSKQLKQTTQENWDSYNKEVSDGTKVSSDVVFGTNLSIYNPRQSKEGEELTAQDAIFGSLPWFSRYANENNNIVVKIPQEDGTLKDGIKDYPAPNLLPVFWNDPNMGIAHETCTNSVCYYLGSDEAPLFKLGHHIIPGADSDSAFHDAGKYPNDSITTAVTIPPYFLFNKIGAIGTFFDIPNWKQNFIDPNTNIFKKPEIKEITVLNNPAEFPNMQPSQVLSNSGNSSINLKLNKLNNEH